MSSPRGVPTVTDAKPVGRLLLVEADAVISAGLCQALGRVGFSVSVVRCLRDARGQLEMSPGYSAVISEYFLPDGTGQELLNERQRYPGMPVPVLLISGNESKPMPSQHGLEFLSKPFTAAQLLDAIHALLQKSPPNSGPAGQQSPVS